MSDFVRLGVEKTYIKALSEININTPTPVQEQVLPILNSGHCDLVAQAQTGTGKTAAFGLPLLRSVNLQDKVVQAVILCPTRELCQQIAKQLFKFTKYGEKIFTEAVYGGEQIQIQLDRLKRPTHIIVATPGRLIDVMERGAVNLDRVDTVVLDEADEMLSMGFRKQLDKILFAANNRRQTWLFSATIGKDVQLIIREFLRSDAEKVTVSKKSVVNKNIDHQYVQCDQYSKLATLQQFLKVQGKNRGLVFCRTKAGTQELEQKLLAKGKKVAALHGDLGQRERDKVLRSFKKDNFQTLIATDMVARGIDIDALNYVVHYDLPEHDEYYTHRSGRTARAGRRGVSLSFVSSGRDMNRIKELERKLYISINRVR